MDQRPKIELDVRRQVQYRDDLARRSRMVATCSGSPKRATNISLTESLLADRREFWLKENAGVIESSNAYMEQHSLPLAKYGML